MIKIQNCWRFCATYGELDRLKREGSIISNDIHSFLQVRLDERRDQAVFEFTWLAGRGFDRVEGFKQTVRIRWSRFRAFLEECRNPDGPRDFKALSLDVSKDRPRLAFDGNRDNLHAAIGDPVIRRKLGKALMTKYHQEHIRVIYAKATAAWFITNKTWVSRSDVTAYTTFGTDRRSAYEILEETLNLRDVRVYDTVIDPDGKERRVLNAKATTLAAQKQQMIKDAFKDWLWRDPDRRRALVRVYNDTMNCIKRDSVSPDERKRQ